MNREHAREAPELGPKLTDALVRSLIAFPELGLRLSWLHDKFPTTPLPELAWVLNDLAERARSTDEKAREAMVSVAIFLAQSRGSALLWALRQEAKLGALLNLERLLRERPEDESQRDEIELEPRVPDYGTGREMSVGERRSLARRPTRLQIDRLLLDPHPLVLEQLFLCPSLIEEDVVRVASRRPARLTALELLVNSPKWMARRRVRLSLILNPGTPHGVALPLVSTCMREDLGLIIGAANIHLVLRSVAHELYQRLPPVNHTRGSSSEHTSH